MALKRRNIKQKLCVNPNSIISLGLATSISHAPPPHTHTHINMYYNKSIQKCIIIVSFYI
jgi:hypothetical protein